MRGAAGVRGRAGGVHGSSVDDGGREAPKMDGAVGKVHLCGAGGMDHVHELAEHLMRMQTSSRADGRMVPAR